MITLDFNAGTYTMEEASLWGIVGSGYNDWGATNDYMLTEVNPGYPAAAICALMDAETAVARTKVAEGKLTCDGVHELMVERLGLSLDLGLTPEPEVQYWTRLGMTKYS